MKVAAAENWGLVADLPEIFGLRKLNSMETGEPCGTPEQLRGRAWAWLPGLTLSGPCSRLAAVLFLATRPVCSDGRSVKAVALEVVSLELVPLGPCHAPLPSLVSLSLEH